MSNDGELMSSTEAVGITTNHLYMDQTLSTTGTRTSGFAADSVCDSVPQDAKQVSFGGWFCPNCAQQ